MASIVKSVKHTKELLNPVQYDFMAAVLDTSPLAPRIYSWMSGVRGGKGVGAAFAIIAKAIAFHTAGIGNGQWLLGGQLGTSWQENNEHYFMDACESFGLSCALRGGGKRPYYQVGNWGKFYLFGGGNKRSFNPVRGLTLCGAWIDEVTLCDKKFFQTVLERMSFDHMTVICTTNAGVPNDWIFKDFIYSDEHDWRILDFRTKIEENIALPREVLKRLYNQNPNTANYKRMVLNEITPDEGAVYQLSAEHIVDQDIAPDNAVWVVDPGTGSVTAALEFVPQPYGYLINREYYHDTRTAAGMSEASHVRGIGARFSGENGQSLIPQKILVDPAGDSMRKAFVDIGYRKPQYLNRKDETDWDKGVQVVNDLLWRGNLKIHSRCANLRAEAAGHIWADDIEQRVLPSPDHALDCMRYGAMRLFPNHFARLVGG